MTVNINKFNERFGEEYRFLYDNGDNVAGYADAVEAFDAMVSENDSFRKFVGDFVSWRGDFISSDREAAAFMFAAESFGLLN